MTAHDIVTTVRGAGFKPTSQRDTQITAERAIAGHPNWFRALVVTGWADEWRVMLYLKRPRARSLTTYEYATVLGERECVASAEHLALYLGGAVSVPVDAQEVRALVETAA